MRSKNEIDVSVETEQQKRARVFYEVTSAYANIKCLSPVTAIVYGDEERPNRKLDPNLINFIIDVEHATSKALRDDKDLLQQWERMVYQEGQTPCAGTIASRCGRLYQIRRLRPCSYFRHVKKNAPGLRRIPLPASSTPKAVGAAA